LLARIQAVLAACQGSSCTEHPPVERARGGSDTSPKETRVTHVVTEPCFDCKYTDCVVVCPVECFYQADQFLVIHPEECIDCEACVPECPVEAIFHEDNVPEQWKEWTPLNAEKSVELKEAGANITAKQDALEGPQCTGKK